MTPSGTSLAPRKIGLVSIVLPTYNEAGNIAELVQTIHQQVTHPHEIIVVDDNSPDGTSIIIQELIDEGTVPGLRLELRTKDRGLTKSIWRGIELAKGDTVIWMDCDFSMPPEALPLLLAKVEEGYDMAVGSRFVPGGAYKQGTWSKNQESHFAIALSRWLNIFLQVCLSPRFRDYTSGFIAVRRDVFRSIRLRGDYGEYFPDFIVRSMILGYSFIEIPYICAPRREGESKTAGSYGKLFRHGFLYLGVVARMYGLKIKHLFGGSIREEVALP